MRRTLHARGAELLASSPSARLWALVVSGSSLPDAAESASAS